MTSLIALFAAAFVAATLVPAQSEAVLVALILRGEQAVWLLVAVATLGNFLGSSLNWALGRILAARSDRWWFPVSAARLRRAEGWYARWGYWSLLGAWLPVVGDPLTLVAGILRVPFWYFAPIVTLAKGARYVVLAWATQGLALASLAGS